MAWGWAGMGMGRTGTAVGHSVYVGSAVGTAAKTIIVLKMGLLTRSPAVGTGVNGTAVGHSVYVGSADNGSMEGAMLPPASRIFSFW